MKAQNSQKDERRRLLFSKSFSKDLDRMNSVSERIRRMLAKELGIEEQALTDDYPWLDALGSEDAEFFLVDLNDEFRRLPSGFSIGEGKVPFRDIDPVTLERISTVRGLIEHVEHHVGDYRTNR